MNISNYFWIFLNIKYSHIKLYSIFRRSSSSRSISFIFRSFHTFCSCARSRRNENSYVLKSSKSNAKMAASMKIRKHYQKFILSFEKDLFSFILKKVFSIIKTKHRTNLLYVCYIGVRYIRLQLYLVRIAHFNGAGDLDDFIDWLYNVRFVVIARRYRNYSPVKINCNARLSSESSL